MSTKCLLDFACNTYRFGWSPPFSRRGLPTSVALFCQQLPPLYYRALKLLLASAFLSTHLFLNSVNHQILLGTPPHHAVFCYVPPSRKPRPSKGPTQRSFRSQLYSPAWPLLTIWKLLASQRYLWYLVVYSGGWGGVWSWLLHPGWKWNGVTVLLLLGILRASWPHGLISFIGLWKFYHCFGTIPALVSYMCFTCWLFPKCLSVCLQLFALFPSPWDKPMVLKVTSPVFCV